MRLSLATIPKRRNEILHFNPESTANVVNQALLQGACKMVHVSSIAALGKTTQKDKEITEETEWGEKLLVHSALWAQQVPC